MKKNILLLCTALFLSGSVYSQNHNDSIQVTKLYGQNIFHQGPKVLTRGDMLDLMKNNKKACQYMNRSRVNMILAIASGIIGGSLVGAGLRYAITNPTPHWGAVGAGAGIMLLAIPFAYGVDRNMLKAVDEYNSKVGNPADIPK